MAYTMTFNTLQDDLRRYLERGFTAESDPYVYAQLPRLINMAERRIASELKIQGFIRAVNTAIPANTAVLRKPDRWRDTISIHSVGTPLFARSYEYLRGYWPDETATGAPEFYADYDYNHWLFVPTPAVNTSVQILYYEQPQFLDDANQTNWLTEYAPNVLLYAALLEATPFLKNDDRVQLWQNTYDRAAQALAGQDIKKITDRNSMRDAA